MQTHSPHLTLSTMAQKTCFVISPIGQEGSETRKLADDLFDLIIEPALEIFDFNVVRGDKIFNAGVITDDIINYVQNAELCIIDLSHQNPNVFYETGRRHETAKPYIHIKRKGEALPFDIAGIRTIDYDLSDGRKTRESIETLRKFITELEQVGYTSQSSGASLNSVATTLTRIERKLDSLTAGAVVGPQKEAADLTTSKSPSAAFYEAYDSGNFPLAVTALKRYMKISYDFNLHLAMATMLVEAYEPSAVPIVKDLIEKNFDNLRPSDLSIGLFALYQYYHEAGTLKDEYTFIKDTTNRALKKEMNDTDRAAFYNILATIEYGVKNDLKALEHQKKTVELAPEEGAYYYNLGRIYNSLDMKDELLNALNMLLIVYKNRLRENKTVSAKYLEYAKGIYKKYGMTDKMNQVDEILLGTKGVGVV